MQGSISRRSAVKLYAWILRASVGADAGLCSAMAQTFDDRAAHYESTRGPFALAWLTLREVWNVLFYQLRRRFGRRTRVSSVTAGSTRPPAASPLGTELHHALRAIAAHRTDAALVIGMLALGVATSSTVYGVADALVLHPAPFPNADRLAQVWSGTQGRSTSNGFIAPALPFEVAGRWLDRRDLFVSGGVSTPATALVTSQGQPELVQSAVVSPGLFEALGVAPARGRTFTPDEGQPGTDHVVMLSDRIWEVRFGRDPRAIGGTLEINGAACTVVGIMPPSFVFPTSAIQLWMPIHRAAPKAATRLVTLTARMQPGVSRDALKTAIEAVGSRYGDEAAHPWRYGSTTMFLDTPHMSNDAQRSIWLLFAATVLLLAIVTLNVANLGMAKVFARTRDVAIRSALGASRLRLIRQSIVEELLLGVCALVLAWPLTRGGLQLAGALLPPVFTRMSMHPLGMDAAQTLVLAVMALLTPVIAGAIPAVVGSRTRPLVALRAESRSTTSSRATRRFRDGLVVLEVACAVVLLVSTALLARSFIRLQSADLGFDTRHLVSVNLAFPRAVFPTGVSRDLYVDRAVNAIQGLPGVVAVTPASGVPPINGGVSFGALGVDGQPAAWPNAIVSVYDVQPDFFRVVGITLRAGRAFSEHDAPTSVIIDEALAARLWPHQDAVGRRLKWDGAGEPWSDVIGVAHTVRDSLDSPELPQIYRPMTRHVAATEAALAARPDPISGYMRLAIRVRDDRILPEIRRRLTAANAAIVVRDLEPVDDEIGRDLGRPRFLLVLMGVFAGAGLVLAAAGIYGVLSCLVTQQLREIGVRLMLGADPGTVSRQVFRVGLINVAIGVVLGLALSAAVARTLGSVLFEIDAHDMVSYVVVLAVTLAVGALSAWRPAQRARRADPLTLLRQN